MRSEPLFFFPLEVPLPLEATAATGAVERLAALPRAGRIVLETRAVAGRVTFFIGCVPSDAPLIKRAIAGLLPGGGLGVVDDQRVAVRAAVSVAFRPQEVPVSPDLSLVTAGLYAAMHRSPSSRAISVIQAVFDAARQPGLAFPSGVSWIARALLDPAAANRPAPRPRVTKPEGLAIRMVLRLGVAGDDPAELRRRGREIESSFRHALSPGGRLVVRSTSPRALAEGADALHGASFVSAASLARLAAWPVDAINLPGLPAAHPKRLDPSAAVERRERVFAHALTGERPVGLSITDAMSHLLAIGPTGSGKTTTLNRLALADILAGRGVVVIDPKDAMPAYLAARIPPHRRDDVVWVDPANLDAIGFNPLDAFGRDPDVVADAVLNVFARTFRESWGPRTADIFSASIRTLTRSAGAEDGLPTLADLPRLWSDGRFRARLLARLGRDLGLESFWAAFDALPPAGQAAWIASPMNKLRSVLLRPAAIRVLCQPTPRFRLRDVFRERRILLLSLNEGLIGPQTAELIGGMVVAELWQATEERTAEPGAGSRPAVIYLDEADRFMATPAISLADALARSRSLSVGWNLAVQHWEALPPAMRAAIKSNARSKLVWHLESDEDARMFARLARALSPDDFMSLPRFHIYASLVAGGESQPWALVRTLGPTPETSSATDMKQHSISRWGGPVTLRATRAEGATGSHATKPRPDGTRDGADEPPAPAGRAPRRPR